MLELLSQEDDETCREWANCIVTDLAHSAGYLLETREQKDALISGLQLASTIPYICNRLEVSLISHARLATSRALLKTAMRPEGSYSRHLSHKSQ